MIRYSNFTIQTVMKNKRVFIFLLALLLTPLILQTALEHEARANELTGQEKRAVAPGNWGGTGIALSVVENGVEIEFDCADAEINKKLMIDDQGDFCVTGLFKRIAPGALSPDSQPDIVPARFEGKIAGKDMTIKITLTESDLEIGDFTLRLGEEAILHKCY
ncbi:MAG: hypothetical protein OEQ28_09670 [Acidobacteriota bacterium]|nr:hypothetical protein [Acidobacteriota bacterium]